MTESAQRAPKIEEGETGTRLAVAGGAIAALAASSCCILPLALFSLGASGAWLGSLSALAPYQPLFVGLAAISLGYGYWRVYRRPAACAEGKVCARTLPGRFVRSVLWLATALVALAAAWPFVVPLVLGQS